MNRFNSIFMMTILLVCCFLVSGCNRSQADIANDKTDNSNVLSMIDYCDWYRDIEDTNTYNYVDWIELDIWFTERILDSDWSNISYDVSYEGQLISTNNVIIKEYHMECYFDVSYEGAVISDNGYLAPGLYEFTLKDAEGHTILSADCNVTIESGDVLSSKVVCFEQINSEGDQRIFRISFDGDITSYAKTGFFLTESFDNGMYKYVPKDYSIEIADTYILIKYFVTDDSTNEVLLSVYCGDRSFVCEKLFELN